MFKVIDYAGETVEEGFSSAVEAYRYIALTFSPDFIREMHFKVIGEEVKDELDSSEL